ncbi:MAG: WS/DGAT/MGAT family O-acyltransferase [Acidimicrobiia bacterium]
MPAHYYERLSFLDGSFLALESPTTHMHVAGAAIFDAAPLTKPDGGIDIDRIKLFIESKLPYVPRYRQRLARVPIEKNPVWVDDEHFDLDYHVRHLSLPKPGSEEQLRSMMGRLLSQQLNRAKPLWELWVVEGIEEDRFALVFKIHHCMIDGISGVDLMAVLLNFVPTEEMEEIKPFQPRPAPGGAELMLGESLRRARRFLRAAQGIPHLAEEAVAIGSEIQRRAKAVSYSLTSGWLTPASRTPINERIGPNRRFEWLKLPLAEVKEIKDLIGGTVNDVVLTTVAGAVRKFFIEERGFPVDDVEFRVMAPVSVRSKDQRGRLGNQVAMWLVQLPIAEPDPLRRYAIVQDHTLHLKNTNQALGASTIVQLSSGTPATLLGMAARRATRIRPFNMTVTNVPGPQFPMYMLGSKLLIQYPAVPLWAGHGLGVALFSYNGELAWGLNADWDVVPDVSAFVEKVYAAFAELRKGARRAAGLDKPTKKAKKAGSAKSKL